MLARGTPRLLVFDSGLGGLTVLRALREAVPEALIAYVADDAFFPYGALSDEALTARVRDVIAAEAAVITPDAVVIACNTASTVALSALRAAHAMPFIGTVPAVKPAAMLSRSGLISVLGTPATVRRDYTRALIAEHGQGCHYTLIGAQRLAGFAETLMSGGTVSDAELAREIAPCFVASGDRRTDVVVLGCTHYPLLMGWLQRLSPWPVTWLDPAPAIARRTANVLAGLGFAVGVGASRPRGSIRFTSGRAPAPQLRPLLEACGLDAAASTAPDLPRPALEPPYALLESPR